MSGTDSSQRPPQNRKGSIRPSEWRDLMSWLRVYGEGEVVGVE